MQKHRDDVGAQRDFDVCPYRAQPQVDAGDGDLYQLFRRHVVSLAYLLLTQPFSLRYSIRYQSRPSTACVWP